MARLTGKVAIVTGGAMGIGAATARRLAADGASVLVADIDLDDAEANSRQIRSAGGRALALTTDVSDDAQVRAMVERAVTEWGRLDILVNNAFDPVRGADGSVLDVAEGAWNSGLAGVITPIYLATRHAVPVMEQAGGGSIVNIASVHGFVNAPGAAVYETGKAAVIGITRQTATEFGPIGIRVNAICPGHIVTERIDAEMWSGNPSGHAFFAEQYPLRRTGLPDDIANAVAFLASPDAAFITGHALVVDGGLTIQLQEDLAVRLGHWLREHPETNLPS